MQLRVAVAVVTAVLAAAGSSTATTEAVPAMEGLSAASPELLAAAQASEGILFSDVIGRDPAEVMETAAGFAPLPFLKKRRSQRPHATRRFHQEPYAYRRLHYFYPYYYGFYPTHRIYPTYY